MEATATVMRYGLLVAVALVLAGCADDPRASDGDDFDDVEVDADTGAIRGVVVDQSIVPIEGVSVALDGDEPKETVTDAQGRFAFSKLDPGFYFLTASKPLYEEITFQASVEAGNPEPPIVTVKMTRLFAGEPFMLPFVSEGYFTCSQANFPGYLYSSSSCHDNGIGNYVGGPAPSTDLSDYGVELPQVRTFHSDVGAGWQTQVFEMTWEASAQGTSDRMGIVVSTEKESRDASHYFANVESGSPMRFQIDVGQQHPTGANTEPTMIPADGMVDMSFFMSVRPPDGRVCAIWCVPPGIAYEQSFDVFLHQFYYLPAPEGWSIIEGDEDPF